MAVSSRQVELRFDPEAVYRKIIPLKNKALSVEDSWAAKHD